jgi:CRISPR-associated protein Cmr2
MADKWQDVQLPYTLNDLATLSRPNNYLGFIHADGNGMGDLVQQQQSEAEYRRFSSRVSYSMRAALWLTLQTHFPDPRPHQDVRYAPFELIALGGDDVILVTVADQAVPVALTLGRWFQHISLRLADLPESEITLESALAKGREAKPSLAKRLTDEEKAKAFTLSAGVVIAHPGQPILNLEERARELLHRAKRSHAGQAAIDFHVISNPVLRSLEDIRREEYTRHKARLTGRPMTFDDLDKLLRHILAFKEGDEAGRLPHNKLNALYEALFTGQNAAEFEAFFLLSRLNPAQQAKLEAFFAEFGISTQRTPDLNTPVLPWGLDEEDNVFTVFADLIELYEFTQANIRPEPSPAPEPSTNLTTEEEGDGSIQD